MKKFFILGAIWGCIFLQAANKEEDWKDYQSNIVLPINKANQVFVSLSVPKQYKFGYDGSQPGRLFMEYIPQNETVHNWTTIITVAQYPGRSSGMDSIAKMTQNAFRGSGEVSVFKVIENRKTKEQGVELHHTLFQYFNKTSECWELNKTVYIQAQNDIWHIACAARYKDKDQALTKESALEKIEEVVKAIRIVKAE